MRCHVLLFAQLADAVDQRQIVIDLPEKANAGDALAVLTRQYPAIAAQIESVALAVNDAFCTAATPLTDGDTLALIPPVSGG